jgi:hypothetical protein
MIYRVTSATHADGKGAEARDWLARAVAYWNEHYPEQNSQGLRNISGVENRGHWVATFESLAVMEEVIQKLRNDASYQEELLPEAQGLWSDVVVNLYQTVP